MRRKNKHIGRYIFLLILVLLVASAAYLFFGDDPEDKANIAWQPIDNMSAEAAVAAEATLEKTKAPALSVPENAPKGIWIWITKHDHILRVMKGDKVLVEYGIAAGKNKGQKQKSGDMRTPEGDCTVKNVTDARSWSHDFKDGKGVIAGAYGPWFIRLETGWNGIGIHGTHAPESIGTDVTEGCIRLLNENVDELKRKYIKPGMRVTIEP